MQLRTWGDAYGYALVATAGARFRIEPIEAPPQLADHAPGAAPRYELLTLGDELLLGLTANGHLTFIGSQLGRRGVLLARNVTITDEATGASFYEVMIDIPDDALTGTGLQLLPGMPVEVYIPTAERVVLTYIMQPVVDQMNRAMREE